MQYGKDTFEWTLMGTQTIDDVVFPAFARSIQNMPSKYPKYSPHVDFNRNNGICSIYASKVRIEQSEVKGFQHPKFVAE